jgi:hypothetical protein
MHMVEAPDDVWDHYLVVSLRWRCTCVPISHHFCRHMLLRCDRLGGSEAIA